MLQNLKQKAGTYLLKREARSVKRKVKAMNLQQVKNMGIIFSVTNEAQFKTVKRWARHLKEEEGIRELRVIGYTSLKEMPHYLSVKLEFDFLLKKDLNVWGKPQKPETENFVQEPFDILVDLSEPSELPTSWLLALSKARLKVGRRTPETEQFLDMMIDTGGNSQLEYQIEQITHYLNIINKPQEHAESV